MTKIITRIKLAGAMLVAFTATAFAADTVKPEDGTLLDLAKPVYDAVMAGHGWLAAALGVIFLTAATRKYLPDSYGGKFIRGDVGGMITAFVFAFAGAAATSLTTPGAVMTAAVALVAFKVGIAAVGGFTAIHKLASWLVSTKFYRDKVPAVVQKAVALLLALIGSSAVAKAEAAGQKAVDANPPTGIDGVIGAPSDV